MRYMLSIPILRRYVYYVHAYRFCPLCAILRSKFKIYLCNNNKAQCIQLLLLTFTLTIINCTKCQKLIYSQRVPWYFLLKILKMQASQQLLHKLETYETFTLWTGILQHLDKSKYRKLGGFLRAHHSYTQPETWKLFVKIMCKGDLVISFTAKYVFEIINSSLQIFITVYVCSIYLLCSESSKLT